MDGRYGPYVKWDKVNATLPKGTEPADVTLEMALALIAEKAAKKGGRKKLHRKRPRPRSLLQRKNRRRKPG